MKKLPLLLFFMIHLSEFNVLFAQSVTISPSGTGAIIEANSTTKGIMPPKMTMTQRANLTPTAGMQVYCTDCTPSGPYTYDGSGWKKMFEYQTTSGPCVTYTVGQQALGGTIIFVDESGQHGLVAANQDYRVMQDSPIGQINAGMPWGTTETQFSLVSRFGILGGQQNSLNIIEKNGWADYAAFNCSQLQYGGYGDWYLPSIGEMGLVYTSRSLLTGLEIPGVYWTSTENTVA